MKNMTLKSLSFIILAFIAIYGGFVIYSAMTISKNVNEAHRFWLKYQDISSTRTTAYNSIAQAMGYGGMIHQFKNYILRKDAKRIIKVRVATGEALSSLTRYSEAPLSAEERAAVKGIKGVIEAYAKNVEVVEKMVAEGQSARQIDKLVKISDGPAIRGLEVLKKAIETNKVQKGDKTNRIELLSEFNRALGFGNMIHQFKNYVLRQDAPRIAKVNAAIKRLRNAIDKYREFPINPEEDKALRGMMSVVAAYQRNLSVVQKMATESKTPEEIDRAVKIDDAPALAALRILRQEVGNKIKISKGITTEHMDKTTEFAKNIFLGSAAGLALLMLLISYVLLGHVLGPINKISKTLDRFIEGDLDIEFYGTDRKDELGYMAMVIDKLRLILISYALRQSNDGADNKQ